MPEDSKKPVGESPIPQPKVKVMWNRLALIVVLWAVVVIGFWALWVSLLRW